MKQKNLFKGPMRLASVVLITTVCACFGTVQELSDGDLVGDSATKKLGFYGHARATRPANNRSAWQALQDVGLMAPGGSDPSASLSGGTFTGDITIADGKNIILNSTTGTKIGTATTQKLAFFNATPVVQQANTVTPFAALQTFGFLASGGTDPTVTLAGNQTITGTKTFPAGGGSATYIPTGRLYSTGTAVNTGANTTETDGSTYTVPANTLSGNGQCLRYRVYGTTGATGNNKTVQLYFGGTSVFTTGAVAANSKPWFLNLTVIRTAAGAQTVVVEGQFNAAAVASVGTLTKDETTALVIKNTMTNGTAAASDCTTSAANLEYMP